jgi:hypothetical protein
MHRHYVLATRAAIHDVERRYYPATSDDLAGACRVGASA